jgi:hypothetical protein
MRPLLLLGALVALAACTVAAEPEDRDVEATDGTFALDVPDGWRSAPDLTEPPVVLVAEGPVDLDRVLVSLISGEDGAEQRAIAAVVALADSYDLACERLEETAISDGPVFDCPDESRRPWVHKVFVPITGDGVSALLLVQVRADSFGEAAAVAGPMVESFVWR